MFGNNNVTAMMPVLHHTNDLRTTKDGATAEALPPRPGNDS